MYLRLKNSRHAVSSPTSDWHTYILSGVVIISNSVTNFRNQFKIRQIDYITFYLRNPFTKLSEFFLHFSVVIQCLAVLFFHDTSFHNAFQISPIHKWFNLFFHNWKFLPSLFSILLFSESLSVPDSDNVDSWFDKTVLFGLLVLVWFNSMLVSAVFSYYVRSV